MKTIILILAMLTAAPALASNSAMKQLHQYPYWVRSECLKLTVSSNRKATYQNYPAALQCARNTMESLRQREMGEASLEYTREATRFLKNRRNRRY